MADMKRKRASPAKPSKEKSARGVGERGPASSAKRESPTGQTPAFKKQYESALAENKRLAAAIQLLKAEVERLRREAGGPGEPVLEDGDVAEALRRTGLKPDEILTYYNHGHGRIVLVPKSGKRVVVDLLRGPREEAS
ncbi:MAG: hypothetical protein ACE5JS_22430 [Nitrospinota bacterium]